MRLWVLLIGIASIVLGLFGGAALSFFFNQTYDPVKDPVAKMNGTSQVELKKGDYEIWVEEDNMASYLKITDPDGNEVEAESPDIAPIQRGHNADFLFTAEESGTYRFERNDNETIYIVEPKINTVYTLTFGPCCGGIVLALLGIIIVIIGIVLKKKK